MEIRTAELADKTEIIALYERSQAASGLPNPALIPCYELGERLYELHAIERFVAVEAGRIVGHVLIEEPNKNHLGAWRDALENTDGALVEMGAAFVEPALSGRGIWTGLLLHQLNVIRKLDAHPVTATWSTNEHVKRTLQVYGGIRAGQQATPLGDVDLYAFPS